MKGLVIAKLGFLLLFFLVLDVESIFAWSCAKLNPCMKNANADAVFIGEIKDFKRKGNSGVHKVEIKTHFSGLENKKSVEVYTNQVTSCAFSMEKSQTYLIFANINDKSGWITTGYCSGTKLLKNAKEEIKFLESLKDMEDGKGVLRGSVLEQDLKNRFTVEPWKPKEIDKVYLENEKGEKFETEVKSDGTYSFTNLLGGWYQAKIFVPERLISSSEEYGNEYIRKEGVREIKSKVKVPGSGCEAKNFYSFFVNGIISGKVIDSNNVPLARIPINIYRFDNEDDMPEQNYKVWSDENGNYVAKGMPSGRYLIGFGIGHSLYIDSHFGGYLPTFYPDTTKRKNAEYFSLGDAEFLKEKNLQLPAKLNKRKVTGKVFFKNKKIAPNSKFSAFAKRDGVARGDWTETEQVNSDGTFKFTAYEETEYTIIFWTEKSNGNRTYSSKCIKINKNGSIKPINVVLKSGSNCRVKN